VLLAALRQPLAAHDRERLQEELDQELRELSAHYLANKESIAAISKRINELEKQLGQIKIAENQRLAL